ncbi:MAG: zinc-finger domain-containing protein [Alphaproteobacteria bacterium]|nr:zinc-finger domain-containing protein [Alphaproteobacteria bacterium]MDA8003343.1 zinc-finger domain-containing protein [Alphaproteobacteria bacterium]MDA8005323.1 zinc-finger domain-containing protein [Alphaproteobacteria bacterium]MDA8012728.1 zinc-finger domain-containing protein [Alphaproteobacteria bacterium]
MTASTQPPVLTRETRVACDGRSPADPLGHPKIFLSLADGETQCPYCSRTFRKQTETRNNK